MQHVLVCAPVTVEKRARPLPCRIPDNKHVCFLRSCCLLHRAFVLVWLGRGGVARLGHRPALHGFVVDSLLGISGHLAGTRELFVFTVPSQRLRFLQNLCGHILESLRSWAGPSLTACGTPTQILDDVCRHVLLTTPWA